MDERRPGPEKILQAALRCVAVDGLSAPLVGYVLRRLQAGGPSARQMVDHFSADTIEHLAEGERAGSISPSRDPHARARVVTEMALGALLTGRSLLGAYLDSLPEEAT